MPTGTLYIVATPIGNLEDITLRAIRILKEVDLIAAEDTRHTRHLLDRHHIDNQLTSYHDHNKEEKGPVLVARLLEGKSVALVSDAGTPGISDPGYFLINLAIDQNIPVVPIPGRNSRHRRSFHLGSANGQFRVRRLSSVKADGAPETSSGTCSGETDPHLL